MRKWLLIVAALIIPFVGYNKWVTDQQAREILDGITRAGVVRAYSCGDRTTPSITVNSDWATLRAQTQRGVLNAVKMVCSTTTDVEVRQQ